MSKFTDLTVAEIRWILDRTHEETVVEPRDGFQFRISKRGFGYSDDKMIGALQAKLSIMLEVIMRQEQKK